MIVKDLQPFSIVEDVGFKSSINYLEPSYKHPLRYTLSTTLLMVSILACKKKTLPSLVATKKLLAMQEQLRSGQKPLKLKMDVITRRNSTLEMIERITILQEPLEAALELLHNPIENLSETDWQVLPEIIKVLKPFKQLTE
ncbi:hypothetical protein HHI36_001241 [Cryptolaemus montrouzieri]|uniref:Uncharacterized protein n=1 Tax=Cryptolaemus montrouzieri TaxID=559131 RepID=A0ABD2P7N7_9CUCU